MIYHYTSIETLALILESGKMRFNRLDAVDDIEEGSLFHKKNLSQFIFVNCWTKSAEENIALWKMYTNGKGVRIELPDYPWIKHPIDFARWEALGTNIIKSEGVDYHIPFTFDEVWADKYFILPPYSMPNSKEFSTEIEYLDEDDLKSKYSNMYREDIANNRIQMTPKDFGRYKNKMWEFQKEFRYILFIYPTDFKIVPTSDGVSDIVSMASKYLVQETLSKIEYFDLRLATDFRSKIKITLGPLTTYGDELIVQSLMNQYQVTNNLLRSSINLRK